MLPLAAWLLWDALLGCSPELLSWGALWDALLIALVDCSPDGSLDGSPDFPFGLLYGLLSWVSLALLLLSVWGLALGSFMCTV